MPNKRYIKGEKLEKSIWEHTHGQIHGKDHSFAGIRPVPTPRLAPHLDPFGAVENVPREIEDMSDYFNWRKELGLFQAFFSERKFWPVKK